MFKRALVLVIILCIFLPIVSGCCYFSAKKKMADAEAVLAELKAKGGATKAPYEYCSAESFLQISKLEFAVNNFKEAERMATRSISAGQAGLKK